MENEIKFRSYVSKKIVIDRKIRKIRRISILFNLNQARLERDEF